MNDDALRSIMTRLALLETRIDRAASADVLYEDVNTWTPTFAGTGTAGTFTYQFQAGYYQQVGSWLFLSALLGITAITVAPTGNLQIGGIPLLNAATTVYGGLTFHTYVGLTLSAGYVNLHANLIAPASTSVITQSGSNVATIALPAANLVLVGGIARIWITGSFFLT